MFSVLVIFLVSATLANANEEEHCVMRGQCGMDPVTMLQKPCVYNGTAVPLKDESSVNFLKDLCPDLNIGSNTGVCCDVSQVETFRTQLDALVALFKRCPSCMHNLANVFCHLICSPRQSSFLQVTNFTTSGKTQTIKTINYYISEKYAQGLFDSCMNVRLASTDYKAIDIACGSNGKYCTPHLWLEFMGSHDPSPYEIKFNFETYDVITRNNERYHPMNGTVVPCSKAVSFYGLPCATTDCPAKL